MIDLITYSNNVMITPRNTLSQETTSSVCMWVKQGRDCQICQGTEFAADYNL